VPELGAVREYVYFSDRLHAELAEANGIDLEKRSMSWGVTVPGVGNIGRPERVKKRCRDEVAETIRTAIGDLAPNDFVTNAPLRFASGTGFMQFGQEPGSDRKHGVAKLHTEVISSDGGHTHVCLFGSMHNYIGFRGATVYEEGWPSSAWPAIEMMLECHGRETTWSDPENPDDFEPIAYEAVKIMRDEGFDSDPDQHQGVPQTRGFTLAHGEEVEWLARIYRDVTLTSTRWSLDPGERVERVLIGAPYWVRSARPNPLTLYTNRYRRDGLAELEARKREVARADTGQIERSNRQRLRSAPPRT